MLCAIVLEFDDGDGAAVQRVEVMRFHRTDCSQASDDVGLSLAEGKSLDLAGFVAELKRKPGAYSVPTPGAGSLGQLMAEAMNESSG